MSNDDICLQHLTGGNLISHPPVFADDGEHIFLLCERTVNVYSTVTGEYVRRLVGASNKLISMQLELRQPDEIVACTEDGVILRWKWETGNLVKTQSLNIDAGQLLTFNLLNMYRNSGTALAFITVRRKGSPVTWNVVDTSTEDVVRVPCSLRLTYKTPIVDVDAKNFKYLIMAQEQYLYFVQYDTWTWIRLKNPHEVPVNVVRVHPKEAAVATGDNVGKIFIWRNFMSNKTVNTSLYHWHHTAVTGLAFSASGSSFYSSGLEAVLVRWNIEHREQRNFLPRMNSVIVHIAVNKFNTCVAVCTADNGINLVGNDMQLKNSLQQFTFIRKDQLGRSQFPIGLRMNPRNNSLVLNGRVGHLQFFSPYSRKLLYNMDVVLQNQLSFETEKILYDIFVQKAAFNVDWIATGELFNDEEHLPESRLKFWQYDERAQSYKLNTNIELPHEGGFKSIEFSSSNACDKLLCASVGEDNIIKIWTLENSNNIYRAGSKVWVCIAKTRYKNLNVESISFAKDGSLLAAGYGDNLCIYIAETLKLKTILTAPPCISGNVHKCQIIVATGVKSEKTDAERRLESKNLLQKFNDICADDKNSNSLCDEFTKLLNITTVEPLEKLEQEQKLALGKKIAGLSNLSVAQKLLLYQRLEINCKVESNVEPVINELISSKLTPSAHNMSVDEIQTQLLLINRSERYKAKYRLKQYEIQKTNYNNAKPENLIPFTKLLNLKPTINLQNNSAIHSKSKNAESKKSTTNDNTNAQFIDKKNENLGTKSKKSKSQPAETKPLAVYEQILPPLHMQSQLQHVKFFGSDNAYMVLACNESRIFVWNLLTLRLHAVIKLSAQRLALCEEKDLVAVITKDNTLLIFNPILDKIEYYKGDLPKIHGLIWMPRQQAKKSKHDWISDHTVCFLTENQELVYLSTNSADSTEDDLMSPIAFCNTDAPVAGLRYSTFGKYITKSLASNQSDAQRHIGSLVLGNKTKDAVQRFIDMTTHTMPPLNALCLDFLKTLTKSSAAEAASIDNGVHNHKMNGLTNGISGIDSDTEDNVAENKTHERRKLFKKVENYEKSVANTNYKQLDTEETLKIISEQCLDISF